MRHLIWLAFGIASLCCFGKARAEPPPAAVLEKLRGFDPEKGDVMALLRDAGPQLAQFYLKLAPGQADQIEKGGPLSAVFSAETLGKLDAAPGSLPLVVYKKEDGRLPGAFIIARHRDVVPAQMAFRLSSRSGIVKHPLVDEYQELSPPRSQSDGGYGAGARRQTVSAFYVISMPFGAGLFGLRPSYMVGEWDNVVLPSGVAIVSYLNRPITADEQRRFQRFKDKKGKERVIDDDYYQGNEYRLTSILIPEREGGQVKHTIQVYYVRIVPALKPGTTLVGSGPLARWLFTRGAAEALVTPVKMIRDELARIKGQ